MIDDKQTSKKGWAKLLRDQFMAGLIVILPIGASILILYWVFTSIDNILQPVIRAIFHHNIPGVGFGVTVVLIYLAGVVARNFIGKRLVKWGDTIMMKVPIIRGLYRGIRQIMESVAMPDKPSFLMVVLIEFPRKEIWTLGLVTKEITTKSGGKFFNVLIPTSPTPWTGYFQIVKETDTIRTNISVEDAVKILVSGGMTVPQTFLKNIDI
jgi:uncharacterized membrane protein